MKAVFVLPIYKRLELTKLCVQRLVDQGKRLGFDVVCVGDLGDKEYCKGAKFYEHENNPLSAKINYAISKCKSYDRVIIWGSDNFATDNVLKPLIDTDVDVIGYDSIYFYSNRTKKSSLFTTDKMSVGVGRSYSGKVLEKYNYEIYNKSANSGLDSIAFRQYQRDFKETILKLEEGYLLDVKHESNITNHAIVNVGKEVKPIWNDLIIELDKLTPKESEKIKLINKVMENKMIIEILEDTHGMSKGTQKAVKNWVGKSLISRGIAKQVDATKKKVVTNKKVENEESKSNSKEKSGSKTGKRKSSKASK